jgi:hypothetical protein
MMENQEKLSLNSSTADLIEAIVLVEIKIDTRDFLPKMSSRSNSPENCDNKYSYYSAQF